MTGMRLAEQDFDLSLLPEADLVEDPRPEQSLQLDVTCWDETTEGGRLERLSIRTTPRQFDALIEQYRALRYSLIQRGQAQAERESPADAARREALAKERVGRPDLEDPVVLMDVLEQVRRGLERKLGPTPRDSPLGEIEP
ncbi:hypothetical protein DMB38_20375 [Streptomyces sp. WAC 06738]|uniref:hypothetical protein n=1 Tax=Streptomyces sp. WAC 06738 TaxID=2203210 RepID=UPI000F6D9CC3|nr:hypothetical protein [Streptomyces sp. WAC 06738]AZM47829.1 hypothetical protein DMB38_20375 [Streptomyces sp. WAC 06738]